MGLTMPENREITTIIKRDGSKQPYKYEKIIAAIRKAFKAVYPDLCEATIGAYTLRVSNSVSTWLHGTAKSDTVHTEEIQDVIECMLMQLSFHDVAKAFILYRSEHSKLRAGKLATDIIGTYLDKSDWRVRENSNSGYCYASLMNHVAGTMIANYCLENVYSHDVANAHIEGDIHLHDLSAGVVGYCFVGSTKIMLAQGRAKSFEELYNEHDFSPDVFSIDDTSPDCACVKPAKSVNLRITRRVTETVTVVLSNGIEVECTPDHAFMTSACPCRYTEARHLKGKTVIVTGKELYKRLFMSEYTDENGVKHRTATEYPYIKVCDYELNDVEVTDVRFNTYDKPIPVYDLTVPTYHNFALEGGIMVHNCAGWSIRDLLMKGFIGKYGRANAGPAKHLDTALLQAANFLCTLQTEWAGAQAFNSFDTFMAPFVRHDNLNYDDVKQRVQQFVFGLNIASRYGQCVTMKTKLLKADGTVAGYDELKLGDEIVTFDVKTGKLKTDKLTHLTLKHHKGIAHEYYWAGNGSRDEKFIVTPEHRMVHRVKGEYFIEKSSELFKTHEYLSIPEVDLRPCAVSHVGESDFIEYIEVDARNHVYGCYEVSIDEDVWCPTTDTGTFVAYIDGALVIMGNCPFTNLTFDLACPTDMKDQPVIIGGEPQDTTYGEYQKEMDMINKAFIEVMMNGDKDGRIFSFPIPTYNITEDFPWDSEVAHLLFKMTGKLGAPYFQNFINTDLSPSDVRSMCPLTPDTAVILKSEQNGIRIATINDAVQNYNIKGTRYYTWTTSGWQPFRPVKVPATKVYEITFSNGATVKMGANHLQPTRDNGTLRAEELSVGMWLPFNKSAFGTTLGTKELGFAIGAYAGDGSMDGDAIIYSLDSHAKDDDTEARLRKFWESIGCPVVTNFAKRHVRFVRVNCGAATIIRRYIHGTNALDKCFTRHVFNASIAFKQGILEGYRATDGSRDKRRFYTSASQLRDDLCCLLSSLGMKYKKVYVDTRPGRLGTQPNYRVDYPFTARRNKHYDSDAQYNYYMITDIKEVAYTGQYLYCFELDTPDHLFSLANGLITHNCRLRLDLTDIRKHTGGLFGAGDQTGSIGVVSINVPRIAYLANKAEDPKQEFYRLYDQRLMLAKKALEAKRREINKNFDNGLMPYSQEYLPHKFTRHFSTIGVIGFNEAMVMLLGKTMGDEESIQFVKDVINYTLKKCEAFTEETGNMYNFEAVPGEGLSYRFAKIDKKKYPDIITAGTDESPYYTNSSQLPVNYTDDPFEALELQGDIQSMYSSGTVLHFYIGECIDEEEVVAKFVKNVCNKSKLPFFSLTPEFSICPKCGYLRGVHETCPNHC